MIDSNENIYSSTSSPINIDSIGNVNITENSIINLTIKIIVTSKCTSLCS